MNANLGYMSSSELKSVHRRTVKGIQETASALPESFRVELAKEILLTLTGEERAELIDGLKNGSDTAVRREDISMLDRFEYLKSGEVGECLFSHMSEYRSSVQRLRESGRVIGIKKPNGHFQYPSFQFDVEGRRVQPVVSEVNVELDAGEDPLGALSWWETPNTYLNDATPYDAFLRGEVDLETMRFVVASMKEAM